MNIFRLIFLILGLFFFSFASAQKYSVKNFGHPEGLNVSSFLTIKESDDGYLWLGADGAGVIKYDGDNFDYLKEVQGRGNLHVQHISFNENKILFSTLYSGVYVLDSKKIERIDERNKTYHPKIILQRKSKSIVISEKEISLYRDSVLIDERRYANFSKGFTLIDELEVDNLHFVLTTAGNYVVFEDKIQRIEEWLLTDESLTSEIVSVTKNKEELIMIDKNLSYEIIVLVEGSRPKFFVKEKIRKEILEEDEFILKSSSKNGKTYFLSNKGEIIVRANETGDYENISLSTKYKIQNPTDILVDKNEDIWVTTHTNGIYRISIEAFTKIGDDFYTDKDHISYIGRTHNQDFIFTIADKGTYIVEEENINHTVHSPLFFPDLFVTSLLDFSDKTLISTNKGVYEITSKSLHLYPPLNFLKGKSISLIFKIDDTIGYSIRGKGVYKIDKNTFESKRLKAEASFFYNVIAHDNSSDLYFGTNNGVYKYHSKKDTLYKISSFIDGEELGAYVGNSIKDSYGNLWFSFDNGLMGISLSGKQIKITEEEVLPSLLIYTLSSDRYGNLYVGSNLGITILKVNPKGEVVSSKTYDGSNGFYGYETNMRVAFQNRQGEIYVGTIKGIFKINTALLEQKKAPIKPSIYSIELENEELINVPLLKELHISKLEDRYVIRFKSINAKSNFILYSYRIKGQSEEWSEWSKENSLLLTNLTPGKYQLEIRSTIDRQNISEVLSFPIKVEIPFYKNKWFIVLTIGIIVFVYVAFVDRTKKYDKKNIIISRDIGATQEMGRELLIISAVANSVIHILASRIDTTIENYSLSALLIGGLVLFLFFIIKYTSSGRKRTQFYLGIGFLLLLGYNLALAFLSDIHPFYVLNILLLTFIISYVFRRLRAVILLSLVLLVFAVLTIFFIQEEKYNQYLYVIAIALTGALMVFVKYLRNKTLEHLIFTSGIVNNGNVLVVAFDLQGTITFASENTEVLLGVKKRLKGEKIAILNNYYPSYERQEQKNFQKGDITKTFKDGAIFLTPLLTAENKIMYYQWSCKEFSKDVRVILGQDVTDKINFENYYELIVNNAEDIIFQIDMEGRFVFMNEKGVKMLGWEEKEIIGKHLSEIVDETSSEIVKDYIRGSEEIRFKDGYLELLIKTAENNKKWLGVKLTTMYVPGVKHEIQGFLGLARDITEDLNYKKIIEEQNRDITDSINYARRIQFNMLPRLSDFEEKFHEFFILYRPRDIVSGDFFWLKEIEGKTILIVADCTGHGVPGSFMATLGINILNQIIVEGKIINPGSILNLLDEHLTKVLPRDGRNKIRDGMEIVVCAFDPHSDLVEYATAGGRFIVTNSVTDQVSVIRGQNKHIGDDIGEEFVYSTEILTITEDQTIYLFTDGFPDQFGGIRDKKLTFRKFLKLIKTIANQDLKEQNLILKEYLDDWIKEGSQTDDITVVGIKGIKK